MHWPIILWQLNVDGELHNIGCSLMSKTWIWTVVSDRTALKLWMCLWVHVTRAYKIGIVIWSTPWRTPRCRQLHRDDMQRCQWSTINIQTRWNFDKTRWNKTLSLMTSCLYNLFYCSSQKQIFSEVRAVFKNDFFFRVLRIIVICVEKATLYTAFKGIYSTQQGHRFRRSRVLTLNRAWTTFVQILEALCCPVRWIYLNLKIYLTIKWNACHKTVASHRPWKKWNLQVGGMFTDCRIRASNLRCKSSVSEFMRFTAVVSRCAAKRNACCKILNEKLYAATMLCNSPLVTYRCKRRRGNAAFVICL